MKKQQGLSLISTLFWAVIVVLVVVLGIRLIPVYVEYFSAKADFTKIVNEVGTGATDSMYRNTFSRYAQIDDISSIKQEDLIINRRNSGAGAQLSADYQREVKLFSNVSLLFRFHVESGS